jgi:EAL domain-containing protein (putative c-di-GMP-specific phosphodiesterase class I)
MSVETVKTQLDKLLKRKHLTSCITTHYGIAELEEGISVKEAGEHACIAMHIAQDSTNAIVYFDEQIKKEMERERSIKFGIENALKNEEIIIAIQPIFDLNTCETIGGEVLSRWKNPQKGLIMPGNFIPILETTDAIIAYDHYVWEKACSYLQQRIDAGLPVVPLSVNVSRRNFYSEDFVFTLKTIVRRHNIPASLLHLEITEGAYVNNIGVMHQTLAELREFGFKIVMDDFGSGYSSLGMLNDIEIDVAKIDRKFVMDMQNTSKSKAIIALIVSVMKELHLPVIAEGIENSDQHQCLATIGCDMGQGFYYSKPMSFEDFFALVEQGKSYVTNRWRK